MHPNVSVKKIFFQFVYMQKEKQHVEETTKQNSRHNISERNRVIRMKCAHNRLLNCLMSHFGVKDDGKMSKERVLNITADILEVIAIERMITKDS